jgi:hypothetical protein
MMKAWTIERLSQRTGMVMAAENIGPNLALAHKFADEMQRARISAAEGCFILAVTYGIWLDGCAEANADHCDAMIELIKQTARGTFTGLRMLRELDAQLIDEALATLTEAKH